MPASEEMPDTIRRSPKHAQALWSKVHDSAVKEYGEGERSHRTAFAALKNEFEKVGDHWEAKKKRGPSDAQAARTTKSRGKDVKTAGGVDANASKSHLYDIAKRLEIPGRSAMSKDDLVDAIGRENRKLTRKSS
ncbi:ChaB family protein [Parafrigoribacterium mesophilum]|uniref:ChaB family protein n=1 Tax=Parafrigoribacterium mesophilum TaxID=433646 RepID=UPI0031FD28A4